MPRFQYAVLSRSQPGQDADYERWYVEQHLPDVRAFPGVVGARLFRLDFQRLSRLST